MSEQDDRLAAINGVSASAARMEAALKPKPVGNNNLSPGVQAYAESLKLPGTETATNKPVDESDNRFSDLSPGAAAFARSLKMP